MLRRRHGEDTVCLCISHGIHGYICSPDLLALLPSSRDTGGNGGTCDLWSQTRDGKTLSLGTATMTPPGTVTTTTAPTAPFGITSYPISTAYNDGSQPTSLTYSDNEVLSYGYDVPSGWLAALNASPAGQPATPLLNYLQYSGAGGAVGHPTIAQMAGSTYNYSASYDADVRRGCAAEQPERHQRQQRGNALSQSAGLRRGRQRDGGGRHPGGWNR